MNSALLRSMVLAVALAACARSSRPAVPEPPPPQAFEAHVRFLSHDLLEGRGIATRGGRLAAAYIESVFRAAGLQPALGRGFDQPVPMAVYARDPVAAIRIGSSALVAGDDFVLQNYALQSERFQGEPLFVGYAIQAPEQQWDDFKGVDVRGRLLVAFTNEPGRDDPKRFRGKELTIHGRWRTKFERAARLGAAGMLLIHTDADAGYSWSVVRNSWGDAFRLAEGDPPLPFEGWLTEQRGRELARQAGLELDELRRRAEEPGFRPIPLPVVVEVRAKREIRAVPGGNVVGVLPGASERAVLLMAHYDHLGVGQPIDGDAIYNGALDNGSALAVLLALAQSYGQRPRDARPTLVFAAVDAEEEGLLGSEYLARHPPYPLEKTIAAINFEISNVWGRTRDLVALGAQHSEIHDLLGRVVAPMGLRLSPDPVPEQGFFFRSDQYSFARAGVPAVWIDGGTDYVGRPQGWGEQVRQDYRAKHYHQPSDEVQADWSYDGLVQLAEVTQKLIEELVRVGRVEWKPESEFAKPVMAGEAR